MKAITGTYQYFSTSQYLLTPRDGYTAASTTAYHPAEQRPGETVLRDTIVNSATLIEQKLPFK